MKDLAVLILFVGTGLFLFIPIRKKLNEIKKYQQEQLALYEQKRERYRNFTSEVFDQTPDEELTQAVIYHIMSKEDKLYEGDEISGELIDVLTPGEKIIYTIYQIEASMNNGRGSLHSFFINEPYCQYRNYAIDTFEKIGCHDVAKLMQAALKLAEMIEKDEEIENDDSEYGNYNFADFTSKLISMMQTSQVVAKATNYVRANKKEFIDMEVK